MVIFILIMTGSIWEFADAGVAIFDIYCQLGDSAIGIFEC
jgi:hypothetical protein